MAKKSNKVNNVIVARCEDGAFRKFITLDQLQVDWTPPATLSFSGVAGAISERGVFKLGVLLDEANDNGHRVFLKA